MGWQTRDVRFTSQGYNQRHEVLSNQHSLAHSLASPPGMAWDRLWEWYQDTDSLPYGYGDLFTFSRASHGDCPTGYSYAIYSYGDPRSTGSAGQRGGHHPG